MDRKSTLPVSPEQFAAYLDGNLTDGEMARIERLAATDDGMRELLAANDAVDDWLDENGSAEDDVPETLRNGDFPIPELDEDLSMKSIIESLPNLTVACACMIPESATDNIVFDSSDFQDNLDIKADDASIIDGDNVYND